MEDDPKNALGCILLALGDERITPDNLQNFLSDLMTVFNVSVTSAAVAWTDMWASAMRRKAKKKAKLAASPPAPELADEPVVATAEAVLRARAIAAGKITPLPVDPAARAIIRAAAKGRGEQDKPL